MTTGTRSSRLIPYPSQTGRFRGDPISEGAVERNRTTQEEYAKLAGYRLAGRGEDVAYFRSLLAKEQARAVSDAERHALEIYRCRHVRDDLGGLDVNDRDVTPPSTVGSLATFPGGARFLSTHSRYLPVKARSRVW